MKTNYFFFLLAVFLLVVFRLAVFRFVVFLLAVFRFVVFLLAVFFLVVFRLAVFLFVAFLFTGITFHPLPCGVEACTSCFFTKSALRSS